MNPVAARVAIGSLAALMTVNAGYAQQPPRAKPAPKLDAEALRIPDSIHDTRARPIDKPQKTLPPPSLPNKVDLGKYDLEFRAKSSADVNPRTGFDSGEKSNLSNSSIGRKGESGVPNYFGLKLSTPTD
jgi:hypothetical protein